MFEISLLLCLLTILLFCREISKGFGLGTTSTVTLIFLVLHLVAVPAVNIYSDTFVHRDLLATDPRLEMTHLTLVYAIGLIVATGGAKFAGRRLTVPTPLEINYTILSKILIILFPASLLFATYNNVLLANLIVGIDAEGRRGLSIYRYLLIECAPMLYAWLMISIIAIRGKTFSPPVIALVLFSHLGVTIWCNFSRGSRVAMLVQLIIAVILFQDRLIRFNWRHLLAGLCAIVASLPIYANYKYAGIDGLNDFIAGRGQDEVVSHFNDPYLFVVGDIGRSDVQAPILTSILNGSYHPPMRPESYIAALNILLPNSLRSDQHRDKTRLGYDAMSTIDPGTPYNFDDLGRPFSSRIYGLIGESMLNFGLWTLPVVFLIYGYLTRKCVEWAANVAHTKNLLFSPFFVLLPVYLLFYDLDNIIFQTAVVWSVPFVVASIATGALVRKH